MTDFSFIEDKIAQGQLQDALETLIALPESEKTGFDVQNLFGIICYYSGQYEDAKIFFELALNSRPYNADCLFNMAQVQSASGELIKALHFLRLSMLQSPGYDNDKELLLEEIRRKFNQDAGHVSCIPLIEELESLRQKLLSCSGDSIYKIKTQIDNALIASLPLLSHDKTTIFPAIEILNQNSCELNIKSLSKKVIELKHDLTEGWKNFIYLEKQPVLLDAYSNDYLTYDYHYLRRSLKQALSPSSKVRTLITGLSYSRDGLEAGYFNNAVNLSSSSQDLYYASKLIKMVSDKNDTIKNYIMGISHYSFGYDLSKGDRSGIPVLLSTLYPLTDDPHNYTGPRPNYESALQTAVKQLKGETKGLCTEEELCTRAIFDFHELYGKCYYNPKIKRTRNYGCYVYRDLPEERIRQIEGQLSESRNKLLRYPNTEIENIHIMNDLIAYLNNQGHTPIFIVFPAYKSYRELLTSSLEERFYHCLNEVHGEYRVWDYFNSCLFSERDFVDPDHLNEYGSAKMTELVIKRIEENSIF